MDDSKFIPLPQDATAIARLIHTLKEGTSIFFSFDNNTGHSFDWIAVEKQHCEPDYFTYYVTGTGTEERELEEDEDVNELASEISTGGYRFYIIQAIEGYKKFRDPYEDDQALGSYEINGPDPIEPQYENLNKKPMKIKQQLLESLIRVCAKEVLTQLNEAKNKNKRCKCGKELILGTTQCKECMEECGLTSESECGDMEEGDKHWIQKAIKKPGALHKQLHVPADEKIPTDKLNAAAEKGGKLGKRANLAKTLKGLHEDDTETIGASSTGSGDSIDIPTEKAPIESEPSEPETPKKKEKLKGIVLLTPEGELREVPMRQWADDAAIERTLHRVASSIAGRKVKVSISALKTVKKELSNPTPTYVYLGTLSDEAEELFLFANKNLNAAKEEAATPEKIQGEEAADLRKTTKFNPAFASDEEFGHELAGENEPSREKELGYDDSDSKEIDENVKLKSLVKNLIKESLNK